ncbi:unnamed protein product [Amoebophrya sp. A120]|nr:unnamed protein product [Amoebophrya sp. A120]|eukprot:GSA120T00000430001.1
MNLRRTKMVTTTTEQLQKGETSDLPTATTEFIRDICREIFPAESAEKRAAEVRLVLSRLQLVRNRADFSWTSYAISFEGEFKWKETKLVQDMCQGVDEKWHPLGDRCYDDFGGFLSFVDNIFFKHLFGNRAFGTDEETYRPIRKYLKQQAGRVTVSKRTLGAYATVFIALMIREVCPDLIEKISDIEEQVEELSTLSDSVCTFPTGKGTKAPSRCASDAEELREEEECLNSEGPLSSSRQVQKGGKELYADFVGFLVPLLRYVPCEKPQKSQSRWKRQSMAEIAEQVEKWLATCTWFPTENKGAKALIRGALDKVFDKHKEGSDRSEQWSSEHPHEQEPLTPLEKDLHFFLEIQASLECSFGELTDLAQSLHGHLLEHQLDPIAKQFVALWKIFKDRTGQITCFNWRAATAASSQPRKLQSEWQRWPPLQSVEEVERELNSALGATTPHENVTKFLGAYSLSADRFMRFVNTAILEEILLRWLERTRKNLVFPVPEVLRRFIIFMRDTNTRQIQHLLMYDE